MHIRYKLLTLSLVLLFIGELNAQYNRADLKGNEHRRILFILDASSSMTKDWNSTTRFDEATAMISLLIDSLQAKDPFIEFSLRVLGSKFPANEENCQDTRTVVGFQQDNQSQMKQALEFIEPIGWSPINFALKAAANDDLIKYGYYEYGIILLTDGEESCGGDICKTVEDELKEKFFFQPYIIGLDPSSSHASYYDCIGEYIPLQTFDDERKVIRKVMDFKVYNPPATATIPKFPAVTAFPEESFVNMDSLQRVQEKARLEREKWEKFEAERLAKQEKIEQERLAKEKAQREKEEKAQREKEEAIRIAKERKETRDRIERERRARLEAEQKQAEKDRIAREKAEKREAAEREKREEEERRLAEQRKEEEEKARKIREADAKIEAERLAAERETEKQRKIQEEADRRETERIAKADQERLDAIKQAAEEKAKQDSIGKAQAEQREKERLARENAKQSEAEKQARLEEQRKAAEEKAEKERLAKEEADRLAAEKQARLEEQRKAAEKKAEEKRLAKEKADRLAAEKQARLEAQRLKAEEERLAAEEKKAKEEADRLLYMEKLKLAEDKEKASQAAEEQVKEEADKMSINKRKDPSPIPNITTSKIENSRVRTQTEDADKTLLKIYLRGSNGEYYFSTPVMSLYKNSSTKPDITFSRQVDEGGEPQPIEIAEEGNYTITFGKDVTFMAKNVYINKNKLTKVIIDVKPGSIRFAYGNNPNKEVVGYTASIQKIFPDKKSPKYQKTEERKDYTPGNYHVTLNTLPELELNVDVFEGSTSLVTYVSEPGTLVLPSPLPSEVTLLHTYNSSFKPFLKISNKDKKDNYKILPGMYKAQYQKDGSRQEKKFYIRSNQTKTLELD